jgi:hypothetical protein
MGSKRVIASDAPINELLGKLKPAEKEEPKLEARIVERVEIPDGYKLDPRFIEKKSTRLQLVLKPSVAEKLKKCCKKKKISINEFVGQLIEDATKGV